MGLAGLSLAQSPEGHEPRLIADWPLRPWLLAALLAAGGLALHALVGNAGPQVPWRAGGAAFVLFGALALAFTLSHQSLRAAAIFAALIGLVMGGIAFNAVRLEPQVAGEEYAFAAGVFFALLAVPLFQAGFHRTGLATDYTDTHFHVWADAVSGAGALAFTGISWALLALLDQLFGLVGFSLIGELIREGWFAWAFSGAAFGAALGVLRNNLKIVGALQGVVLGVLGLLAVPLALALVVFVVLLLASGGRALWNATDQATPILLACAGGCFVLLNAVIRDTDARQSSGRLMPLAAAVLAAGILPLALFAAISMGLRVGQHGLSPERIWGVIAVALATAYGLAGWAALVRGRRAGWSEALRRANLRLAAGVCGLALVLALPLADFGAICARNQIARLEAGRVSPENFDYTALRWDFGAAGRRALARLAARGGVVGERAKLAQAQAERPADWLRDELRAGFTGTLRVQSADPALGPLVRAWIEANPWACAEYCVALDLGEAADGRREIALVQGLGYERVVLGGAPGADRPSPAAPAAQIPALGPQSRIELRRETVRTIHIDGQRIGPAIEDAGPIEAAPLEAGAPGR